MVVAILYAKVDGQEFSSYYIFWGSLIFGVVIVSALRWGYDRVSGVLLRAAGYHRRAVLVGTGQHIEAVAHALAAAPGSVSPIDVVGFISLTPRPDNGLRSLGQLGDLREIIEREQLDEVIIADPAFPQQEAVELVDECHRRGVRVRIAPSTMEILVHRAEFVPGEAVPLFELRSPVFEGFDWFVKRAFDVVGSVALLMLLSPLFALMALAVKLTSRGPVLYHSMRPGIGGVPFACLKFRTMYEGADERQAGLERHNEADGALFKMRDDPRVTPVGRRPAPLLARRAAAAVERRARRDVARRPAAAAPARLRPARGLAPQALPRAPGHHRPLAGLGALGARLRRPRAARLPLPRALVRLARPLDPRQDDPGGVPAPGRLLSGARRLHVAPGEFGHGQIVCPMGRAAAPSPAGRDGQIVCPVPNSPGGACRLPAGCTSARATAGLTRICDERATRPTRPVAGVRPGAAA